MSGALEAPWVDWFQATRFVQSGTVGVAGIPHLLSTTPEWTELGPIYDALMRERLALAGLRLQQQEVPDELVADINARATAFEVRRAHAEATHRAARLEAEGVLTRALQAAELVCWAKPGAMELQGPVPCGDRREVPAEDWISGKVEYQTQSSTRPLFAYLVDRPAVVWFDLQFRARDVADLRRRWLEAPPHAGAAACQEWFEALMRAGPAEKARAAYLAEAQRRFGISNRAASTARRLAVAATGDPHGWTEPGPKSNRRSLHHRD